jgi:putative phosphoesterase
MVRVGVLSDTHISDPGTGLNFLENLVEKYFPGVELFLHAGDIVNPDILAAFGEREVYAVRGNMDPPVPGIPLKRVIEIGGFRIGLIHGYGSPQGLEQRIRREFATDSLDCLVYGHTHLPACHFQDGILLFNPGSCTDRRRAPWHSAGLLEIDMGIDGRIIRLDE